MSLPPFTTLDSSGNPWSNEHTPEKEAEPEADEDPERDLIVNGRQVCPECGDTGGPCSECGRVA